MSVAHVETLLDIDDGYTALRVTRSSPAHLDVSVTVRHEPLDTRQVSFSLNLDEFRRLVDALEHPGKSRHGHLSLWTARSIYLMPKHVSSQTYREITLHRASLLGGWRVPATLSTEMVRGLKSLQA